MTLEIIHPITFRKYRKHQIKVSRNKNNVFFYKRVNLFIKGFSELHLNEHFCTEMYLKRETFLRYKILITRVFFSQDSFSSKNAVRGHPLSMYGKISEKLTFLTP